MLFIKLNNSNQHLYVHFNSKHQKGDWRDSNGNKIKYFNWQKGRPKVREVKITSMGNIAITYERYIHAASEWKSPYLWWDEDAFLNIKMWIVCVQKIIPGTTTKTTKATTTKMSTTTAQSCKTVSFGGED